MDIYTIMTRSLGGQPVTVTSPIIGYHGQTGAPILSMPQMDDKQWEELAARKDDFA